MRVLGLCSLTNTFGEQIVHQDLDLDVRRGEIIGVIGRSGAGKSTLLRCINGLQEVTKGSVVLDGEAITGMGSQQLRLARRHIGFIWQEYNLVERLTVMENVLCGRLGYVSAFKAWLRRYPQSDIDAAFDLL